jgi:hypothetical protein
MEDNIKIDVREIDYEVTRCLELPQNRDQGWVSGLLALDIAFYCRIEVLLLGHAGDRGLRLNSHRPWAPHDQLLNGCQGKEAEG